jgi:hypothetical protein
MDPHLIPVFLLGVTPMAVVGIVSTFRCKTRAPAARAHQEREGLDPPLELAVLPAERRQRLREPGPAAGAARPGKRPPEP